MTSYFDTTIPEASSAMALKTFVGAWGAVSVSASECVNATLAPNLGTSYSTDMAVDANGTVWLTSYTDVYMCPDGECQGLIGDPQNWMFISGIAVDVSNGDAVIYVSHIGGLRKCTLTDWIVNPVDIRKKLECIEFGNDFMEAPSGLDLDHDGNVLVTVNSPSRAVKKCSPSAPSARCVSVGGTDRWLADFHVEIGQLTGVAADSTGNTYVSGMKGSRGNHTLFVVKCTSAGTCEDFGSQLDRDQFAPVGALGLATSKDDPSLAVGPDDYVYISDAGKHSRCSPDGFCENIAALDGSVGNMAIDQDGMTYVASLVACPIFEPGCTQLSLRQFCFDTPADILQV